jgi:hypothetical protein
LQAQEPIGRAAKVACSTYSPSPFECAFASAREQVLLEGAPVVGEVGRHLSAAPLDARREQRVDRAVLAALSDPRHLSPKWLSHTTWGGASSSVRRNASQLAWDASGRASYPPQLQAAPLETRGAENTERNPETARRGVPHGEGEVVQQQRAGGWPG